MALSLRQLHTLTTTRGLLAIELIHLHHLRGIDGAHMQQLDDMIAQGASPDRRITRACPGRSVETRCLV